MVFLFVPSSKEKAMKEKLEKVRNHFRKNAVVYIAVGVTVVEVAAGAAYTKKARARHNQVLVVPVDDEGLEYLKGGLKHVIAGRNSKGREVVNLVHEDRIDEFMDWLKNGEKKPS
jgi:hypothetical protein